MDCDRSRSRHRWDSFETEEDKLSKLLTKILRYDFIKLWIVKDPLGFVLIDNLLPHLGGNTQERVLKVASNSFRKKQARFEVTQDGSKYYIRVMHPCGSRRRDTWRIKQYKEYWESSSRNYSRWQHQALKDGDDAADDNPQMLIAFLRAALAWLSSHSVVPDTQRIKGFIMAWNQMDRQNEQTSEDVDRKHCLALITGQIAALETLLDTIKESGWQLWQPCRWNVDETEWAQGSGPTQGYWANFHLSKFLSAMNLENYDSSWQMSWAEVRNLFDRGQWYDF